MTEVLKALLYIGIVLCMKTNTHFTNEDRTVEFKTLPPVLNASVYIFQHDFTSAKRQFQKWLILAPSFTNVQTCL